MSAALACIALALMALIPLIEILVRPLAGSGIANAPVIVQHLGLVMAMFGSVAALRHGHLSGFGKGFASQRWPQWAVWSQRYGQLFAALVCGVLCMASARLVESERQAAQILAYGIPVWWLQASMPLGFALLGLQLGTKGSAPLPAADHKTGGHYRMLAGQVPALAGLLLAWQFDGQALFIWPAVLALLAALLCGAPIFAVLGALAFALFWQDALPLASVALSHYQITVNPSLPALPLFTLAGLVFARTGAAQRLGAVFVALFGGGATGTVVASAVLCSAFTAFTGGSGVTILALGGLLLPLLRNAGFAEQRGISLVTSASALGVLLAPSVPLIMYAIIARVPINTMFLAGLLPACIMVVCLLVLGGYLKRQPPQYADTVDPRTVLAGADRRGRAATATATTAAAAAATAAPHLRSVLWRAKWEILAPVVAIGALVSGLATPTESAAIAAAYAILTQVLAHRELGWAGLSKTLAECTQIIGGVMLILSMALGLTNYLIEAGVPDAAIGWVQGWVPNKWVFLLVLNVFLFFAGALMEIFAALVVLVPLLLPLALSYGIDPVHFGIIFLANMELGFLCPPAGMNIYFAAAMFDKPVRYVATAVLPALLAIFLGTLVICLLPASATWLPTLVLGAAP